MERTEPEGLANPETYRIGQWIIDLTFFLSNRNQAKTRSPSELSWELDQHFRTEHGSLGASRKQRIATAIAYADRHQESFNEGKIAILGENVFAVGEPLMWALYAMYSECPEDRLGEDFPIATVLELAREAEKRIKK